MFLTYIKHKSGIIFIGDAAVIINLWPSRYYCHQADHSDLKNYWNRLNVHTLSLYITIKFLKFDFFIYGIYLWKIHLDVFWRIVLVIFLLVKMYKSQLMISIPFGFALYTFDHKLGMWHDHIILLMHEKGSINRKKFCDPLCVIHIGNRPVLIHRATNMNITGICVWATLLLHSWYTHL